MCGIAGQARAGGAPVERSLVERMCAALEHRGPDSRGLHFSPGAGLGIQRLRVIDLETGDQPVYNEDRTVAVVLNGEIYNYRELRSRLERSGHTFATQGDTEVIAHLYEEEGPDCVRSLQGMFGFAIWDLKRRRLVLARDRVGKKPLFYCVRDGVINFASELGSLMQDQSIPRDLDHGALDLFLSYLYVPAPLSAFAAVRKLPPATVLEWEEGRIRLERYWRLDYSRKRSVSDPAELHEQIRDTIKRCVARRLVADVPVGALLSGGVDSSAVVAAMAQVSSERVKTFSIGFEHAQFDERPYAREIAELFDTEHHEFVVEPRAIELLPTIVRAYGEPFADSSAIPSFYLSELTRRHVTVALGGDGGDESFAGYTYYAAGNLAARLDRLPLPLRVAGQALGRRLPESGNRASTLARAKRLAGTLALDGADRFGAYRRMLDAGARADLYTDDYAAAIGDWDADRVIREPWAEATGESVVDRMMEVDIATYLPGDLLMKLDIATMAYGLEARSPLLDPELMQFAAEIPAELKLRGTRKKALLRDALRAWIPGSVLDRPKQGFSVPLADWLRGELRDYSREVLLDPSTLGRGYHREEAVRGLLEAHAARDADHSSRIWSLLVLELWHREAVDPDVAPISRPALAAA